MRQIDIVDIDGTDKACITASGQIISRSDKTLYAQVELEITDPIYESGIIYLHPANARELGRRLIEIANKTEEEWVKCQLVDKK